MAMGRVGGWQLVKSTAFDVERTGIGHRFRGRGFGHGVGLCVVGTGVRAARGESTEAILRFYFPTLTIGRDAGPVPTTAGKPSPGTPATTSGGGGLPAPVARDVQIALPAVEEPERDRLVALVRSARDRVAAATGHTPPASLRVTVHPTVESFGRATGQPWWISGATAGSAIDLLPVTLLRQQGQLERTIRHEVAHALLDGALAGRPMWVREGAAIHFSRAEAGDGGAAGSAPATGRVRCPTDEELLRPVSAGAQRDAYARAETCFARQIRTGKKWTEVR